MWSVGPPGGGAILAQARRAVRTSRAGEDGQGRRSSGECPTAPTAPFVLFDAVQPLIPTGPAFSTSTACCSLQLLSFSRSFATIS